MLANTRFMRCKCVLKNITTSSDDYYYVLCAFGAHAFRNRSVRLSLILYPALQNGQHKFDRP